MLHTAELIGSTVQTPEGCEYLAYKPLSCATEQWVGVTLGLMRPMRVSFAERPDQIQKAIRELACEMVFFGPRQRESLAARVHARMLDAAPWRIRTPRKRALRDAPASCCSRQMGPTTMRLARCSTLDEFKQAVGVLGKPLAESRPSNRICRAVDASPD